MTSDREVNDGKQVEKPPEDDVKTPKEADESKEETANDQSAEDQTAEKATDAVNDGANEDTGDDENTKDSSEKQDKEEKDAVKQKEEEVVDGVRSNETEAPNENETTTKHEDTEMAKPDNENQPTEEKQAEDKEADVVMEDANGNDKKRKKEDTKEDVEAKKQKTNEAKSNDSPAATAEMNMQQDSSNPPASEIKNETPTTETTTVTSATTPSKPPAAIIAASPVMISRDDMAKMEETGGKLVFDVISNDGTDEHMMQLTTLKNIFARQLPKMPREYIVRLVFDRNHKSMIILKNGKQVIGGICYRPFEPNHFAEIAFCAINAADQVKGYGTRLMNHLKEHVKQSGITHFLTYADNYAIGYFKKQGFTKSVSMARPNWFGYIKDYDGGTLMECTIHYQVDYLNITSMVQRQRQKLLDKISESTRSHIVYPGLMSFADTRTVDVYFVPGVKEAGWTHGVIRNSKNKRDEGNLKSQLTALWKQVSSHRSAWPFHEPVDTSVVVDYLDYIKEPIDLSLISKKIETGQYASKAAFKADLDKMCSNCTYYNTKETNYYKAAVDLQEWINRHIQLRHPYSKHQPK